MSEASQKQSNFNLAIGIGLWAVILLVVFFNYRGTDVGQLPNLIGDLGGGSLVGPAVVDTFVGGIAALLIGVSWFGLGNFAIALIKTDRAETHSHILELAIKTAAGSAIWSLIWFFLGVAGSYNAATAIAITVVGIAFAAFGLTRVREAKAESRVPESASAIDKVLLVLIAIPILLAFITALAPPTAKDTLLYHFAVPKAFVAQGSSAFIDGNIASFLSLGMEMHNVWAMLLGGVFSVRAGEVAAGAAMFMFLPLLAMAIFGWARELGIERRWALIAVLIVATVPTVFYVASSAYVDVGLALYVTLAIYALCRWWNQPSFGWAAMMAIFLGAALSVKLTTVFVIAAFALVILLKLRAVKERKQNLKPLIIGGFTALVIAGAIASPWFLRTWNATGSPVFPFYMSIWPGKADGWDVERSNLFQAMNSQYGGIEKSAADYVLLPWNLSVNAQPDIAENFDGVLGVAFLIGIPIFLFALWKYELPFEIKISTGIAAIVFLFWMFSSQQLRYLLPILPVLAIAMAFSGQRVFEQDLKSRKMMQGALAGASIAGILVSAAWFLQKAPVRAVLGGETRDEYLARNLDHYSYYQLLDSVAEKNDKVWLINMRRDTYTLDRPAVSDYLFEDWTFRKLLWESRNEEDLRAKAKALGVQYALIRHDFLFDYDRTTLVDEKRTRAENEAKIKLAKEFILDPANAIRSDKKFSLVKVF